MVVSVPQLKRIGHKVELHTMNDKSLYETRTDEAFSQLHYNDHQKKGSPFIHANVPCVTLFVLD